MTNRGGSSIEHFAHDSDWYRQKEGGVGSSGKVVCSNSIAQSRQYVLLVFVLTKAKGSEII